MQRIYVFADEAGCFVFKNNGTASRYFILTTVTCEDCGMEQAILELRRQLAWEGTSVFDQFHATEDQQAVRDRVFEVIAAQNLRVDATILDKRKTQPHLQAAEHRFYKMAWYLHLKHVAPLVARANSELMVTGASLGTRKQRYELAAAVTDVVRQVSPTTTHATNYWPAASDPCLQVADYCCWAIQRKWEKGDDRSYRLIAHQVRSEFDAFRRGSRTYY